MISKIWPCLLLLFLVAIALDGETRRSESVEPFPLSIGTSWTYQGLVRWTHDINKVSERKVEWKMEVRRVLHHGEYTGALISGWPSDLDWSDGNPKPTDSLIISFHNKFYLIPDHLFAETVGKLEDQRDALTGMVTDDDFFLQVPLEQGQKFCEPEGMARSDGRYCWVVQSAKSVKLVKVNGVPRQSLISYRVRYITNPDDIEFDFVPGVGIVRYEYHHHGTVADTELRLSEFRPAPAPK